MYLQKINLNAACFILIVYKVESISDSAYSFSQQCSRAGWFNPIPAVSWRGRGSRWLCGEELSTGTEGLKGQESELLQQSRLSALAGLAGLGSSVILCVGAV